MVELFRDGLWVMRRRGDLADDADPRHLAVALVAAHQGGTMLTYATGTPEPLGAMVNAAVDYVASFRNPPRRRTRRSASRPKSEHRLHLPRGRVRHIQFSAFTQRRPGQVWARSPRILGQATHYVVPDDAWVLVERGHR